MRRRRELLRWSASLTVVGALFASLAIAAPEGAALYRQHCAACHGPNGHGDGADAGVLARRSPDLHAALRTRSTDELVRVLGDRSALQVPLDLPALRARAAQTQAVVHYLERLPRMDWASADAAAALYSERCALCHGAYGHPPAQLPTGVRQPHDLADVFIQGMPDAELVVAVRHGRDGMPALVPRLSDAEARLAAAHVRRLSPGYEIYSQYCAACHGRDGRGVGSGPPTVVFDTVYFSSRDPEVLRRNVWHMLEAEQPRMPHFGATLTPDEAAAIIEWLRAAQQ